MKKYFKFVGVIELIGVVVGIIIYMISFLSSISNMDLISLLLGFLALFALMVLGPAIGLLFICFSNWLPEPESEEDEYVEDVYICKKCGQQMFFEDVTCPNCGAERE